MSIATHLTTANAVRALVAGLVGAVLLGAGWVSARSATETERRLAIKRNADAIETVSEATTANAEAIGANTDAIHELHVLTVTTATNVEWLVRSQGGTPAEAD